MSKNVYDTNVLYYGGFTSRIPVNERADEHHIDVLRAGWKKFNVSMRAVARLTGIKPSRIYTIFSKRAFGTKLEADLIDKAMVHLILEDKRYNFGENPQRK